MTKSLLTKFLLTVLIFLFSENIFAKDLFVDKLDTFISENNSDLNFEKAQTLQISNEQNVQALSYLPFKTDPIPMGFNPKTDSIFKASLILHIKALPSLQDKLEKLKNNAENAIAPEEFYLFETPTDISKIKIEVYAVLINSFDELRGETIVSWNGENKTIAPCHDGKTSHLDKRTAFLLGEVSIDLNDEYFTENNFIEFESQNLIDYLNYAYGSVRAKSKSIAFPRIHNKLDVACIILKQKFGLPKVEFYSSESFDEESDDEEQKDFRPKINFEFSSANQKHTP